MQFTEKVYISRNEKVFGTLMRPCTEKRLLEQIYIRVPFEEFKRSTAFVA